VRHSHRLRFGGLDRGVSGGGHIPGEDRQQQRFHRVRRGTRDRGGAARGSDRRGIRLRGAPRDFYRRPPAPNYIILNADMLGFSKLEQKQISFLVLNQRRRLRAVAESYHFTADWVLVLVFRLACLFCRSRQNSDLPEIQLKTSKKKFTLKIDDEWLAQHPLTREDLEAESHYWLSQDIQFKLSLLSDSGESGQQKK